MPRKKFTPVAKQDTRGEGHYTKRLLRLIPEMETVKLDVGDYYFEGPREELLVERKRLDDLYSSMMDGRLDDQVARLLDWRWHKNEELHEETHGMVREWHHADGTLAKPRRVCIAVEGSYVEMPLMMRLRTYQSMGVEVTWSSDIVPLLHALFKSTQKTKHTPLRRKSK